MWNAIRLQKYIGLGRLKMLIQCLKMQPTDVVTADMLTTIGRCFVIKQLRFDARRLDKHLLLTATLERYEPKGSIVNTVLASC